MIMLMHSWFKALSSSHLTRCICDFMGGREKNTAYDYILSAAPVIKYIMVAALTGGPSGPAGPGSPGRPSAP